MLDHTKRYVEKMHYIEAELEGHVHKHNVKQQTFYASGFAVRMLAKPYHFGVTITNSSFAAGCTRNLLPGFAPISLQ